MCLKITKASPFENAPLLLSQSTHVVLLLNYNIKSALVKPPLSPVSFSASREARQDVDPAGENSLRRCDLQGADSGTDREILSVLSLGARKGRTNVKQLPCHQDRRIFSILIKGARRSWTIVEKYADCISFVLLNSRLNLWIRIVLFSSSSALSRNRWLT